MSDETVEDRTPENRDSKGKEKAKARVTTQRISTTQPEIVDIDPILAEVPPDALGLFMVDFKYLMLVEGAQMVTLGRDMGIEGASVYIDLTPYQGTPLGVSRRHAAIQLSQNMYLLQDLGSTNGTWLNEARLPPHTSRTLNNGDMVRFGRVETCVVFHDPGTSQGSEIDSAST